MWSVHGLQFGTLSKAANRKNSHVCGCAKWERKQFMQSESVRLDLAEEKVKYLPIAQALNEL